MYRAVLTAGGYSPRRAGCGTASGRFTEKNGKAVGAEPTTPEDPGFDSRSIPLSGLTSVGLIPVATASIQKLTER